MTDRRRTRLPLWPPGLAAAAAAIQLAAFWPGILVWDAIRQYRQALAGRYDDWHPPAMNALWRLLLAFGSGPAPMLVLQVALYWGGFALLASAAWRDGRRRLAAALLAGALLPIPLFLAGTILKDSLMAGALLVATGLLAIRRPHDRGLRLLAIALLLGAATLRFNAVPACLPLLVALLPAEWRDTRVRLALATIAAAVPLLLALPIANRLLHAERSGVGLSLVIYDLGGIGRFSGTSAFPPVAVADPVAVNARCYSPVSWDRYAWWGADPCPIGFTNLSPAFAALPGGPYRFWAHAVAAHPLAYATHRLAHYDNNMRFLVHDADEPTLSLASDPNPWGFRVPPNELREALGRIATASIASPLGWPALWLALGIAVLILAPAGPACPIALSAVLYALSYLPLSVASEVRYHVWTMSAVAIAAVTAVSALAREPRRPRWRIALAIALPVATMLAGIAYRSLA